MQRDMNLLRTILLHTEAAAPGTDLRELGIEGVPFATLAHHAELLVEAGLLRAHISYMEHSPTPVYVVVERLTWAGHEFVELARDAGRWEHALKQVADVTGATSFEILRTLLHENQLALLTRH